VKAALREAVHARSRRACEMRTLACTGRAEHVHHRQMGTGHSEELVAMLDACRACHDYAHGHPTEAYDHGWLVHRWDDPQAVPVIPG